MSISEFARELWRNCHFAKHSPLGEVLAVHVLVQVSIYQVPGQPDFIVQGSSDWFRNPTDPYEVPVHRELDIKVPTLLEAAQRGEEFAQGGFRQ